MGAVLLGPLHLHRTLVEAPVRQVGHGCGGFQLAGVPARGLLRGARHQVRDDGAVALRRGLVVGAEAARLGPEGPQGVTLGAHVGPVVGDENQLVEAGEDQAASDGVQHLAVNLGGKGHSACSPARFAHVVRGNAEGEEGCVEDLGLFGGEFHAAHGGVRIDSQGDMVAVLLHAADGNHDQVVTGLDGGGDVCPGDFVEIIMLCHCVSPFFLCVIPFALV